MDDAGVAVDEEDEDAAMAGAAVDSDAAAGAAAAVVGAGASVLVAVAAAGAAAEDDGAAAGAVFGISFVAHGLTREPSEDAVGAAVVDGLAVAAAVVAEVVVAGLDAGAGVDEEEEGAVVAVAPFAAFARAKFGSAQGFLRPAALDAAGLAAAAAAAGAADDDDEDEPLKEYP